MRLSHFLLCSVFYFHFVKGNDILDSSSNYTSRITKAKIGKEEKAGKTEKSGKKEKGAKKDKKEGKAKKGEKGAQLETTCIIEKVEQVLNKDGELENKTYYVPDESCAEESEFVIFDTDERSPEFLDPIRTQFENVPLVNLDEDFATNDLFNESSGAQRVKNAFDAFNEESGNELLSVMVIENGVKVAEFYNEARGVTAESKIYMWSATKTVLTLLLGKMLKDFSDKITYESQLSEIFEEARKNCKWLGLTVECFHEQQKKKKVTLLQLLTMTSGMHDCIDDVVLYRYDIGSYGGVGVTDSLDQTYFKESFIISACDSWYGKCYRGYDYCSAEQWHYILQNNVLSYVLQRITGRNPQDYFEEVLTGELGIKDSDYEWCTNDEGVGHALHGLKMTTTSMAKIGQFYLQQGKSKSYQLNSNVVTEEFMDDIHFNQLVKKYQKSIPYNHDYIIDPNCDPEKYECGNDMYEAPYYSFFVHVDIGRGTYCAVGTGGKLICWTPKNNRVIVITRTKEDLEASCNMSLANRFLKGDMEDLEAMELLQYIDGFDGSVPLDFTS